MDDPKDPIDVQYLWTRAIDISEETIKEWPPLFVSLMGVLEETPRYIRDVNLGVGTIIQMVTTPTLRRGYLCRGVTDYILCEIDSQADRQEATLTFVGVCTTLKEADEWIMGPAT